MSARRRIDVDECLPQRVYKRRGVYFYAAKDGRWHNLGREKALAIDAARRYQGLPPSIRAEQYREIFMRARKSARTRGISWALEEPDLEALVRDANGRCQVTGIAFSAEKAAAGRRRPWMPSLDRKDNAGGYTPDNVRLVCVAANIAMSDFGIEVFRTVVQSAVDVRKRSVKLGGRVA